MTKFRESEFHHIRHQLKKLLVNSTPMQWRRIEQRLFEQYDVSDVGCRGFKTTGKTIEIV